MRYSQRTPENATASEAFIELPDFMDPGDFVKSVDALPFVLEHGLPKDHHHIYFADQPRDDLKTMTDGHLVVRSDSNAVDCTLRAFQRGYNYTQVVRTPGHEPYHKAGTYIGAIEAQVLGAQHRGHSIPQHQVVRTVEDIVEPYVQEAIRDRLFDRAKEMTARTVDQRSFKEFVEVIAEYNPGYDFDSDFALASQLAKQIFDFRTSLAGRRGQAEIVERRLDELFHAIGASDPKVQQDKRSIIQHRLIDQIDHPRRILDRAAQRFTGKPRSSTIEALTSTYGESLSRLDVPLPDIEHLLPRPSLTQQTVGRTALETAMLAQRAAEIDPGKAARAALAVTAAAGAIGFGATNAAAAPVERAAASVSLNVESVSLPQIAITEKSKAESKIVYDARAEKALDAMTAAYNKRGDHAAVRATQIVRDLMKAGLPVHQALGVVGNFGVESAGTFDPKIKQGSNRPGHYGPGRGIAQWEKGGRWDKLVNWAHTHKLDPLDLDTQVKWTLHELNGSEHVAYGKLKSAGDVKEAVHLFRKWYERPAAHSDGPRLAYAERFEKAFMAHYDGTPVDDNNHGHVTPPAPKKLTPLDVVSVLDTATPATPSKVDGVALESVLAFAPETPVTTDQVLPSINIEAVRARLNGILGGADITGGAEVHSAATGALAQAPGQHRAALEGLLGAPSEVDPSIAATPSHIDLSPILAESPVPTDGASSLPGETAPAGDPTAALGDGSTPSTPDTSGSTLPSLDASLAASGPSTAIELAPVSSTEVASAVPIALTTDTAENEIESIDLANPQESLPTPETPAADPAAKKPAPKPVSKPKAEATSLPHGNAEQLAEKILPYIKSGKLSCNNQANNCPDIQMTAIGKSLKGIGSCNAKALNAQMLGTLLKLMEEGHDVVLSSICSDHPSNPTSQHKLGKAVDFNIIDNTFMGAKGDTRWTGARATAGKALLKDVAAMVPAGTGFGQQQCHPAYAFMKDKGFKIYQDPCHHQHVQLPGGASEND